MNVRRCVRPTRDTERPWVRQFTPDDAPEGSDLPLKPMHCVSEMMDYVFKMMDFALNIFKMIFV